MMALQDTVRRLLRGPRASAVLARFGIEPRRFWLLTDLFGLITERGEMLDQLGRNGVALRSVAVVYAGFFALISVLLVVAQPPVDRYASVFQVLTAVLLLTVLLSETGNSLVNPAEGAVLAHQPINGATYTAAKLTHLVRIVLLLVPAMNAVPALAGLALKGSTWSYPLTHMLTSLAIGTVAGLLCCALYGWLIRLLPAQRLKAAGQFAGIVPFFALAWWRPIRDFVAESHVLDRIALSPAAWTALVWSFAAAILAAVVLGIRALGSDYLVRVSGIVHGGSARIRPRRTSWAGKIVAHFFGGQPGRAGHEFVCRMVRRDFQFRRQAAPLLALGVVWCAPLLAGGWRTDPFSGRFTTAHLLPHVLGFVLLALGNILPFGNDYKGAWIFLLAPSRMFDGFTRGIFAALWINVLLVPHLILIGVFAWPWGLWKAGLFAGYSLAVSSLYLSLVLRLIEGMPFSRQLDPSCEVLPLPWILVGGLVTGVAVGVQHFFLFRSPAMVAAAALALGILAYALTRSSLRALEESIRFSLVTISGESGTIYKEVSA